MKASTAEGGIAGMDNPPSISAEELHGYILEAHRRGNLGWSACDAKERVLGAVEFFESRGQQPNEEALLKRALSFRLS